MTALSQTENPWTKNLRWAACLLCVLALGTLAHSQIRLSHPAEEEAAVTQITTASTATTSTLPRSTQTNEPQALSSQGPSESTKVSNSRDLFDQGINHATNGRWLSTLQTFCSIPNSSAYFAPARQQIKNWMSLYPDDIRRASSRLLLTSEKNCLLIDQVIADQAPPENIN